MATRARPTGGEAAASWRPTSFGRIGCARSLRPQDLDDLMQGVHASSPRCQRSCPTPHTWMTADYTGYRTPHSPSTAHGGDQTAMAPLPSAQKTPTNKRRPSAGNHGPVIPSPRMHGPSFTEHRSQVGVPDTPVTEATEQASRAASNSRRPSLETEFDMSSDTPQQARSSFSSPVPDRSTPQQAPIMSPWQHLAATGGAMTPSVERPGGDAISPFFANEFASAGSAAGTSAGGFPGFHLALPQPSSGSSFALGSTAPRSHSPHLGGPFAQLTLGGNARQPSGMHPGTPGVGIMSDPFLAIPHATPNTGSPPSTASSHAGKSPPTVGLEAGKDALAAALAARRRGSRSGPSGLSKSVNADGADSGSPSTREAKTTPALPSGPVASGMRLKMPPGTGIGYRKSSLGSSSPSTSTPPLSAGSAALPEAMAPSELAARMHDANAHLLILDLRQPSAFTGGHAAHAVSLPIPSTLLKRQAFTLDKLLDMLPAHAARTVGAWRDMSDVVIVDQDSTAVGAGSIIAGMANKFRLAQEGEQGTWRGKIWFLRGGMSACRNAGEVDIAYGPDEEEVGQGEGEKAQAVERDSGMAQAGSVGAAGPSRMFGGLSRAAFQQGE